jgi:hypothetical protein
LIKDIVQDTQHSSPSPQVQVTELDNPLNVADSDLIQSHQQDFQHNNCKPFFSFEPITKHPNNYKPLNELGTSLSSLAQVTLIIFETHSIQGHDQDQ